MGFVYFKDTFNKNSTDTMSNKLQVMDIRGYIDYSESLLEASKLKGKTVLFFAATRWCQTCTELENEIFKRSTEIPNNVIILKVDYDNDKKMNQKYAVTSQHTLIVLNKEGIEIDRWVGGYFDSMIQKVNEI